MQAWFDSIAFHMRAQPDAPAMVMEDRAVTYGMLRVGIDRCARRIANLMLTGDAPVAVVVENPIRHVTLCLALIRLGIPSISLAHGQVGLAALNVAAVLGDESAGAVAGVRHHFAVVTDEWFGSDTATSTRLPDGFADARQVCRLSLTSGSTGEPKIIELTMEDIGRRADGLIRFGWRRLLCLPGLSSSWGFWTACATLAAGGTLCFSQSPFQSLRMIELFAIEYVMAATEQLLATARVAKTSRSQLASLRIVEVAGSVPTRALLETAMLHLCKDVYCRYGASETGAMARATARDVLSRPGFAGHVLPGIEIGIFDRGGRPCPAGTVGLVRGRRDPRWDASNGAGAGWIELGDLGWMTPDGELHVLGRASDVPDMENPTARQISPVHEVEHVTRLEWDAADAAAVMGGDGSIWVGIVGNTDARADRLEAVLRAKGLGSKIELCVLPSIPRGPNGKVNRAQLKAAMLGRVGKLAISA